MIYVSFAVKINGVRDDRLDVRDVTLEPRATPLGLWQITFFRLVDEFNAQLVSGTGDTVSVELTLIQADSASRRTPAELKEPSVVIAEIEANYRRHRRPEAVIS